jgi:hypothetical protein
MPTPTSTPAPLSLKGSIAAKAARDLFLLSFFLVLALSTLAFAIGHQLLEDRMFLQLQQEYLHDVQQSLRWHYYKK